FDLGLEVSLDLVNLSELSEGPAAVSFEIVHTGDPIDVHSRLLFLRVFAAVALDLDDQVQQIIVAMAVINQHDEVRQVLAHFRSVPVWDFEAEIVVFDVGAHARMRLRDAAKLGFPIAIQHYPVNMAASRVRFPTVGPRCVEANMSSGPNRIVSVEHCLDGPSVN